jgi:hypothetical protein
LIVTEGEKTEPIYLKALLEVLRLRAAEMEIVQPPFTDPLNLVKHAIRLKKERIKAEKKDCYKVMFDEVWAIFDLEKQHSSRHKQVVEAIRLASNEGIKIADSNPCFEYWLLLHEKYTTASLADKAVVKKEFKLYYKNFNEAWTPPEEFIKKLPTAVKNAEKCRQHHKSSPGGDGNPSTNVDRLACSLNNASRNRLPLY